MSNTNEINGVPLLLSIKLDGVTYCIDIQDNVYIYNSETKATTLVTDKELLNKIFDYLEPKPLDVIM